MKNLKYLNKYFYKYRKKLLIGIFITMLSRIFSLIAPQYVQYSIDSAHNFIKNKNAIPSDIQNELINNILITIGSSLLAGLFTFFMRQLLINVSRHIEFDLKNEIFQKYQTLPQHFYKQNKTGDLMNRISEDVNKVRMYVGPCVMYSIQTITLLITLIPLMFYTSPILTFYTLLPLPFLAFSIYFIRKKIRNRMQESRDVTANVSSSAQQFFSGINIIKAYAKENDAQLQWAENNDKLYQKRMLIGKFDSWFAPIISFLIGSSIVLVLFIGGALFIQNDLNINILGLSFYSEKIESIGIIARFSMYVIMLTHPISSIGWVSSNIQEADVSQAKINEFLQTPSEETTDFFPEIKCEITFKNVSLTYEDTQIKALNSISFSIPKGKRVAIIGKTGSGKSTLIDLITRVNKKYEGEIFIDEHPIESINIKHLRKAISVIPQENFLFSDTIENNILFGNQNATNEQVIEAAKNASVHHNIIGFKNGYQTILGERGVSVSGGQRQRISIARALLKSAEIYLFDDCLSAVDTHTEAQILKNLSNIAKDKTQIIISHRVSITRYADLVLMIENGEVVEQGSPKELFEKNGKYRAYYNTQTFENQ